MRLRFLSVLLLLGLLSASAASAQVIVNARIGRPYGYYRPYGPRYYYPPVVAAPVVIAPPPPVYYAPRPVIVAPRPYFYPRPYYRRGYYRRW